MADVSSRFAPQGRPPSADGSPLLHYAAFGRLDKIHQSADVRRPETALRNFFERLRRIQFRAAQDPKSLVELLHVLRREPLAFKADAVRAQDYQRPVGRSL